MAKRAAKREKAKPEPSLDWAALVIAALLTLIGALIIYDVQRVVGVATYSRIGPATFAYVVALGLFGLTLWTIVVAFRERMAGAAHLEVHPVLWIVGGLLAQIALLNFAGFSIATGFVFGCTARAFGRGPLWLTIPIGAVLAFLLYIAFAKGLQLSLPAGPIERLI